MLGTIAVSEGSRLVQTRPLTRGLVSDPKSGRRVDVATYPAPSNLEAVARFWCGGWDLRGQAPHVSELLSDPCMHFVFEDGGEHAGSRLVGVWTTLWRRTLEGKGRVRGVKLRAGGLRAFVDQPASRFTDRIVPLRSVLSDVDDTESEVLTAEDDAVAFAAITEWLSRHLRPDLKNVRLAMALVDRIAEDSELTTVDRLCAIAGMNVRVLQRLFRDYVGGTPKWVIRRNRLQEVAVRIEGGEAGNFADLAAELGYSDQAHLARDFKAAVGKSPSEFKNFRGARRLPIAPAKT